MGLKEHTLNGDKRLLIISKLRQWDREAEDSKDLRTMMEDKNTNHSVEDNRKKQKDASDECAYGKAVMPPVYPLCFWCFPLLCLMCVWVYMSVHVCLQCGRGALRTLPTHWLLSSPHTSPNSLTCNRSNHLLSSLLNSDGCYSYCGPLHVSSSYCSAIPASLIASKLA